MAAKPDLKTHASHDHPDFHSLAEDTRALLAVAGAKTTHQIIHNYPDQAIAGAFGVGAAGGFLLRQRNWMGMKPQMPQPAPGAVEFIFVCLDTPFPSRYCRHRAASQDHLPGARLAGACCETPTTRFTRPSWSSG